MIHHDMTGKPIQVGDIVIYTEPGAGRNLPGLCFGEVVGLTKASVKVNPLDENKNRKTYAERVEDHSQPPYHVYPDGTKFYRWKETGNQIPVEPVAVKVYKNRFYVV